MQTRKVWLATTFLRNRVRTSTGEDIGKIEDLVIDPNSDSILYGVLSMGAYPELFVIPWSSFSRSSSPDYMLLNVDRRVLDRAPRFDPADWPDLDDPNWDRRIRDYYGTVPVATSAPVHERTVYVDRDVRRPRREMGVLGSLALVLLLLGLLWGAYLVSTRGWDRARSDVAGALSGAAYAMRETSSDAALTAKVKTALSLSKRIPANKINVDSQDDVVTLRGEVESDEVRDLAEKIAADTPGVREVHNHLYAMRRTQ